MRVITVDTLDWTGASYDIHDVVYAGEVVGAAFKSKSGVMLGLGCGPGVTEFIDNLRFLLAMKNDYDAEQEGQRALRVECGALDHETFPDFVRRLKAESEKNPAPSVGLALGDFVGAVERLAKALR